MQKHYDMFYKLVSQYSIGDEVEFKKAKSFSMVQGELRGVFTSGGNCYVTIYSYYKRKDFTFMVNNFMELESNNAVPDVEADELIYYELKEQKPLYKRLQKIVGKTLLILVVISSLVGYLPEFNFEMPRYSYQEFLQKEMSVNKLFNVATARLTYQYENSELWLTPANAWLLRQGDCEEFATICADYLKKHNITSYVTGLYMRGEAVGHAVVFLYHEDSWHMMDLNRAIEKNGLRKITGAKSLRQAISYYEPAHAIIYKIPSYDGEKKAIFSMRFPSRN